MNLSKFLVYVLILVSAVLAAVYFSTDLFDKTISVDNHTTNTLQLFHEKDSVYSYSIDYSYSTSENKETIFGKEYSEITMGHGYYTKNSSRLQSFNDQVLVVKNGQIKIANEGNAKIIARNEDGLIDSFFIEVKEIEDSLVPTVKNDTKH